MTMRGEFHGTLRVLESDDQSDLERLEYYARAVVDRLKMECDLKFDLKGFTLYYNNVW